MNFFGSIILASGSPRRRQLLTDAGFDLRVVNDREVEESYPSDLPVDRIPSYLSEVKARAYADLTIEYGVPLVAADTIVIESGEPLGKPVDAANAVELLKRLSGRWHTVVTGVEMLLPDGWAIGFSETTDVKFAELSRRLIERYVDEFRPLDKAGAYGIQEWIGLVGVEQIRGDFYNIMGFPVCRFVKEYLKIFPTAL